jgi:hypothetical protein
MSFAFNFATDSNNDTDDIDDCAIQHGRDGDGDEKKIHAKSSSAKTTTTMMIPSSSSSLSFSWFSDDEVRSVLDQPIDYESEVVTLSMSDQSRQSILRHVKEGSAPTTSSSTDLVPGVYEGGMKVWECSIDLCQWLSDNPYILPNRGYVLELGCGHGLPGCWIVANALRQSYEQQQQRRDKKPSQIDINVCWSDYNKFCLERVTIPNLLLNIQAFFPDGRDAIDTKALVMSWVTKSLAFGAGDWNIMSNELLDDEEQGQKKHAGHKDTFPSAIPSHGKFDLILAAETTYTEAAAKDTAKLVARHLIPGKGVAIIATKRYYFGVGGGSSCFCEALESFDDATTTGHQFHVETAQVFDDGISNIRELLVVKSIAL